MFEFFTKLCGPAKFVVVSQAIAITLVVILTVIIEHKATTDVLANLAKKWNFGTVNEILLVVVIAWIAGALLWASVINNICKTNTKAAWAFALGAPFIGSILYGTGIGGNGDK
jgi:hypothetical protein